MRKYDGDMNPYKAVTISTNFFAIARGASECFFASISAIEGAAEGSEPAPKSEKNLININKITLLRSGR